MRATRSVTHVERITYTIDPKSIETEVVKGLQDEHPGARCDRLEFHDANGKPVTVARLVVTAEYEQ